MPPDEKKVETPAGAGAPAASGEDFWDQFEKDDAEAAGLFQKSLAAYEANPDETRERLKLAMETPLEDLRGRRAPAGSGEPKPEPKPQGNGKPLEREKETVDVNTLLLETLGGEESVKALQGIAKERIASEGREQVQRGREEIMKTGGEALKKLNPEIFNDDDIRSLASELVVSRVVAGSDLGPAVQEAAKETIERLSRAGERLLVSKDENGNRLSVVGSSAGIAPPKADFKKMSDRESMSWMESALAGFRRGVR